jgi:hypothetical protein
MKLSNTLLRMASGLYTQADLQRICNVRPYSWRLHIRHGLIPKPSHRSPFSPGLLFYTEVEARWIKRHFAKTPSVAEAVGLVSMHRASALVGIPYNRLTTDKSLPRPTHQHGQRRYYKADDLAALKKAWREMPSQCQRNPRWAECKRQGFLSGADAAKALGMPLITFSVWLAKGKLPKPMRKAAGLKQRLYNAKDVQAMRKLLKVHGYKPRR